MLQQRHAELQRVHAEVMHQLGLARAEGQSAASHARELQRRLEQGEARLHAASAFRPLDGAPFDHATAGREAAAGAEEAERAAVASCTGAAGAAVGTDITRRARRAAAAVAAAILASC